MTLMADRGAEVRRLRGEGLIYREIADELGISLSYAQQLVQDRDGSKARARKMQGACSDCGTATYSDGPSRSPQRRCSTCQHAYEHAHATWTPEAIIAAIQRWAELYGKPPAANDWNNPLASAMARKRKQAGQYPPYSQVTRKFGRWSDAINAAGFKCRHKNAGKPRNSVSEAEHREMERLRDAGKTYAEIGAQLGITHYAVKQRFLRRKGGPMSTSLKAETVLEREIQRFEDRRQRAEEQAKDAAEQGHRLKAALAALKNGKPE